jgi:hypothetical protein
MTHKAQGAQIVIGFQTLDRPALRIEIVIKNANDMINFERASSWIETLRIAASAAIPLDDAAPMLGG